ncbi:hypothetical protein [Salinigranum sp. GCM10025319]|uniref:hypothetical protein n=1 Tax=Salinigranum sp. GCM10025319 TaxID=3252687 RepID=UPI00361554EF
MVDDRLADGRRIAELLASELDALGDDLAAIDVRDADRDAQPTPDDAYAYAYRVVIGHGGTADESGGDGDDDPDEDGSDGDDDPDEDGSDGERELAVVFIHPDRARVEFVVEQEVAAAAGDEEGLRVRPKAVRPPRTLVFVEDGAEVKRAVTVFEAVVASLSNDPDDRGER